MAEYDENFMVPPYIISNYIKAGPMSLLDPFQLRIFCNSLIRVVEVFSDEPKRNDQELRVLQEIRGF